MEYYGAEHLLRLFVKMPELLARCQMQREHMTVLVSKLGELQSLQKLVPGLMGKLVLSAIALRRNIHCVMISLSGIHPPLNFRHFFTQRTLLQTCYLALSNLLITSTTLAFP